MTSLYADVEYLKTAIDGLLAQCPELIDDEILRADMLEGSTEIGRVFAAILKSMRDDDIDIKGIDSIRQDLLDARAARAEIRKHAKRTLLRQLMERANLKKFSLPEATLSMAWHQPAPVVVDEAALPDDCVKLVRKPDMAAIQARCDTGIVEDWPEGVAMSNGQNVLSIRVK